MRDLRREALDTVFTKLLMDQEWVVREDDRLSWLAHRLCQTFSVVGPFESRGIQVIRLSSNIPLVGNPKADPSKISHSMNLFNQLTMGDTLIWNREADQVESHISAILHEETFDWRINQFIDLAIIQLSMLESRVDSFAEFFSGRILEWSHPVSGERLLADDMLNVFSDLFLPLGQEPSGFTSDHFTAVEEFLEKEWSTAPLFTAGASETGICIEIPVSPEDTALITLSSDQFHPTIGNGLLVTIQVRLPDNLNLDLSDLVEHLNWLECYGPEPLTAYGAWCSKNEMLVHSHFLPNVPDIGSNTTVNAAMNAVNRTYWVGTVMDPDFSASSYDPAAISLQRMIEQSELADA